MDVPFALLVRLLRSLPFLLAGHHRRCGQAILFAIDALAARALVCRILRCNSNKVGDKDWTLRRRVQRTLSTGREPTSLDLFLFSESGTGPPEEQSPVAASPWTPLTLLLPPWGLGVWRRRLGQLGSWPGRQDRPAPCGSDAEAGGPAAGLRPAVQMRRPDRRRGAAEDGGKGGAAHGAEDGGKGTGMEGGTGAAPAAAGEAGVWPGGGRGGWGGEGWRRI
jgi:hypothetical protein